MKIAEFLLKYGFKPMESRRNAYTIEVNGITYMSATGDKKTIRLVNVTSGYTDSAWCTYKPNSDDFIDFVADHKEFTELHEYLVTKIRQDTIDEILYDLR